MALLSKIWTFPELTGTLILVTLYDTIALCAEYGTILLVLLQGPTVGVLHSLAPAALLVQRLLAAAAQVEGRGVEVVEPGRIKAQYFRRKQTNE